MEYQPQFPKEVRMATPNPIEQVSRDISSLQSQLSDLQSSVRLSSLRDSVEDTQTAATGLAVRIAGLRSRGYVFEKDLESEARTLAGQWAALYPGVAAQIASQSSLLQSALRPVETQVTSLAGQVRSPAIQAMLRNAQAAVDTVESKVDAAERSISGMYDTLSNQLGRFTFRLDRIDWMLKQVAEASFQLLPTEAGIAAVKAVWARDGREKPEDPDGVLYLTDQRLIFEQKEEVATKKVLFIATEKQKVQLLLLEVPVAQVEGVTTSKQGLMKNEDHIEIKFAVGAPVIVAHFHIWESCEEWQGRINKAKTKEYDRERAIAIDPSAVDKVKAVPVQCPSCGGNLSQVILRGQDSVKCQYCGFVIRL
jgi:hypothetical protein